MHCDLNDRKSRSSDVEIYETLTPRSSTLVVMFWLLWPLLFEDPMSVTSFKVEKETHSHSHSHAPVLHRHKRLEEILTSSSGAVKVFSLTDELSGSRPDSAKMKEDLEICFESDHVERGEQIKLLL